MYNLSLHIEYLLLRHDCVIIPGVGAFLRRYKESKFDKETNVLYPMRTEIHFNADITEDDGLLANSFCRKYGLNFYDASSLIKSEAALLRDNLYQDGEVTLGNLGILKIGIEHNISFVPFTKKNELSSRLGFIPVTIGNSQSTLSDLQDSDAGISTVPEDKGFNNFDFNRNYYIPVNKIFAKTAASFLLVIIVALSLLFPTSDRMKEDRASVVPVDTLIKNVVKKTTEYVAGADSIHNTPQNDIEKDHSTIKSKGSYKLIVGTFASEKEAANYIEQMKKFGYDLIDNPSGRLHRVSAYDSNSSAELYAILNSKEFSKTFSQAWVWQEPD